MLHPDARARKLWELFGALPVIDCLALGRHFEAACEMFRGLLFAYSARCLTSCVFYHRSSDTHCLSVKLVLYELRCRIAAFTLTPRLCLCSALCSDACGRCELRSGSLQLRVPSAFLRPQRDVSVAFCGFVVMLHCQCTGTFSFFLSLQILHHCGPGRHFLGGPRSHILHSVCFLHASPCF